MNLMVPMIFGVAGAGAASMDKGRRRRGLMANPLAGFAIGFGVGLVVDSLAGRRELQPLPPNVVPFVPPGGAA